MPVAKFGMTDKSAKLAWLACNTIFLMDIGIAGAGAAAAAPRQARVRQRVADLRRLCGSGGAGAGAAVAVSGGLESPLGATTVAPGPAKTRFTFIDCVRFDNDARIQLARRDLVDVEPIGIMLEIQALNIQAIPIDEVFMQSIVDRVQIGDAELPLNCSAGFCAP